MTAPTPNAKLRQAIATIEGLATEQHGHPQELLSILRELEALHRRICEEMLIPSLPNTRHELFALLQNIEAHGGWPYIYRLRLQELCQNLEQKPQP